MFLKILKAKQSTKAFFITVLICFIASCQTTESTSQVEAPPVKTVQDKAKPPLILPPGYMVCIKSFDQVLKATSKAEEYLLFRGLSQQGILYLFFLGKTSYSVFFMDVTSKAYCTSPSLIGKIVEKPGTKT